MVINDDETDRDGEWNIEDVKRGRTREYKYLGCMESENRCYRTRGEIVAKAMQWWGRLSSVAKYNTNEYECVKGMWKYVAVSSIIFGINVMVWNGGDLEKLEMLQNRLGYLVLEFGKQSTATPLTGKDETFRVRHLISVHSQSSGSSGSSSMPRCSSNTPSSHHAPDSSYSSVVGGQFCLEDVEMPSFVTDTTVNSNVSHLVSLSPGDNASGANTPCNSLLNATLIGSPLEDELSIGGPAAGACSQQNVSEASVTKTFKSTLLSEHLRSKGNNTVVLDTSSKFSESLQCSNQKTIEVNGDKPCYEATALSSTVHLPSVAPPGLLNNLNQRCQIFSTPQVNEQLVNTTFENRKSSATVDCGYSSDFQTNIDQVMSKVDDALKSVASKQLSSIGKHGSYVAGSETRSSTPQENGASPDLFFNFNDDVHLVLKELEQGMEEHSSSNSLLDLENINDEFLFSDVADCSAERSLLQMGDKGQSESTWLENACAPHPCQSVAPPDEEDDLDIKAIIASLRATGRVVTLAPAKVSAQDQLSQFPGASSAATNSGTLPKQSVKKASVKVVTFSCDQQGIQRSNAGTIESSYLDGTFNVVQGCKFDGTFDAGDGGRNGTFNAASGRCDGASNTGNSNTTIAVVQRDDIFDVSSEKNVKAFRGVEKLDGTFETCSSKNDKIHNGTYDTAPGSEKDLHATFNNARESEGVSNSTFNQCCRENVSANFNEMTVTSRNPVVGAASIPSQNRTFDTEVANTTFDGAARANSTFSRVYGTHNGTFECGPQTRGVNCTFDGAPRNINSTFDGGARGGNATFDGSQAGHNNTFDGKAAHVRCNASFDGARADATFDQECFLTVGDRRPMLNRSQSLPCTSPDEGRLNESVQELCASQSYNCINLMDADVPVLKHILKMPPEQQEQLRALCDSPAMRNNSFRQRRSLPSNFSPSCKPGRTPGQSESTRASLTASHESLAGDQTCNITTSTPKPKSVQEILSLYHHQQQQDPATEADTKPHISNIFKRYKTLSSSAETEEKEVAGECGSGGGGGGPAAGHEEVIAKLRRHRQQRPPPGSNGGVVGGPLKAFHPPTSTDPTPPSSSTPNQDEAKDAGERPSCKDIPVYGGCGSNTALKMRALLPSFGSFSSIDSERIGSPDAIGERNLGSTMDSPLPSDSCVDGCRTSTPAGRVIEGPALPNIVAAATPIVGPLNSTATSQIGDHTCAVKESQLKQRFPLSKPLASVFQQQKMNYKARDLERAEAYNSERNELAAVTEISAEPKGSSCSMSGKLTLSSHAQMPQATAAMDVNQLDCKNEISKGLVSQEPKSKPSDCDKTELEKNKSNLGLQQTDSNSHLMNGKHSKEVLHEGLGQGLTISNQNELPSCTNVKSAQIQNPSSGPSVCPSLTTLRAPAPSLTPDSASVRPLSGQSSLLRNCDIPTSASPRNSGLPESGTPSRIPSPIDPGTSFASRLSSVSVLSSSASDGDLVEVGAFKSSHEPESHNVTVLLPSTGSDAVGKKHISSSFTLPSVSPQNVAVDVTRGEDNLNSLEVSRDEIVDNAITAQKKLEITPIDLPQSTASVEVKSPLKQIMKGKKVSVGVRTSVTSRSSKIGQQFGLSKATNETSVSASSAPRNADVRTRSSIRRRALTATGAQRTPTKLKDELEKPASDTAKQNMNISRVSLLAKKPVASSTSALEQGQKRVSVVRPRYNLSAKDGVGKPVVESSEMKKMQCVIKAGHQTSTSAPSNVLKPKVKSGVPPSTSSSGTRLIAPIGSNLSTRQSLLPQSQLRKPCSGLPRMSLPHASSMTSLNGNSKVLRPSLSQLKLTPNLGPRNNFSVPSRFKSGAISRNSATSQISPTPQNETGFSKVKCDKENNPPPATSGDVKVSTLRPLGSEKTCALAPSDRLSSSSSASGKTSNGSKSTPGKASDKTGVPTLIRPPGAVRGIPRPVPGASGLPLPSRFRMPSVVKK
ncbi:hypothetical protein FHG87_014381 [Trinorchestia longiramus]|nr:hypothetical protein FHG87_014381 [Trinorchestia longiramus]